MNQKDREDQARSRAARIAAGGKAVHVMLEPQAAAKLAQWLQRGETATSIINRLLQRSKP